MISSSTPRIKSLPRRMQRSHCCNSSSSVSLSSSSSVLSPPPPPPPPRTRKRRWLQSQPTQTPYDGVSASIILSSQQERDIYNICYHDSYQYSTTRKGVIDVLRYCLCTSKLVISLAIFLSFMKLVFFVLTSNVGLQQEPSEIYTDESLSLSSLFNTTSLPFTILDLPELTTWLIGNYTSEAIEFYNTTLNEEQGEVWLHRGLTRLLQDHDHDHHHAQITKSNYIVANRSYNIANLLAQYVWWRKPQVQWMQSVLMNANTPTATSRKLQQRHSSEEDSWKNYTNIVGDDLHQNTHGRLRTSRGSDDIIIVCAYLHFNQYLYKKQQHQKKKRDLGNTHKGPPYSIDEVIHLLKERIDSNLRRAAPKTPATTFVLAVPTWNPKRGNEIGLSNIQQMFTNLSFSPNQHRHMIRYMSLGYERNIYWQKVPSPDHIIPIPYVVAIPSTRTIAAKTASTIPQQKQRLTTTKVVYHERLNRPPPQRRSVTIFYTGDTRPNAVKWSGCNRTALLQPIIDHYSTSSSTSAGTRNVDVHLIDSNRRRYRQKKGHMNHTTRLSMSEYNDKMLQSKYCLIVCGDTPTSRSLSSAIVHGCIPLFIGKERWYGYCESISSSVCHPGWGWNVLHDGTMSQDTTSLPQKRLQRQQQQRYKDQQKKKQSPIMLSHFPYETIFDYSRFPSIDEYEFLQDPVNSLERYMNESSSSLPFLWPHLSKDEHEHNDDDDEEEALFRSAYIYGYGHPITTELFGNAVLYIWESIIAHIAFL